AATRATTTTPVIAPSSRIRRDVRNPARGGGGTAGAGSRVARPLTGRPLRMDEGQHPATAGWRRARACLVAVREVKLPVVQGESLRAGRHRSGGHGDDRVLRATGRNGLRVGVERVVEQIRVAR